SPRSAAWWEWARIGTLVAIRAAKNNDTRIKLVLSEGMARPRFSSGFMRPRGTSLAEIFPATSEAEKTHFHQIAFWPCRPKQRRTDRGCLQKACNKNSCRRRHARNVDERSSLTAHATHSKGNS